MAKYGNSKGNNRGKKYTKLKPGAVATPENKARAHEFMNWYAENMDMLKGALYDQLYDEGLALETFFAVYDAIALKGAVVASYKWYYLRAYHTTRLQFIKGKSAHEAKHVEIRELAEAPDLSAEYAHALECLDSEVMRYVRANYSEIEISLFEMYVHLYPDISYNKLGALLGMSAQKIWPAIGRIKKDLVREFGARKASLLSLR